MHFFLHHAYGSALQFSFDSHRYEVSSSTPGDEDGCESGSSATSSRLYCGIVSVDSVRGTFVAVGSSTLSVLSRLAGSFIHSLSLRTAWSLQELVLKNDVLNLGSSTVAQW